MGELGIIVTDVLDATLIEHGEKGPAGGEPGPGEVWISEQNLHGEEAPWFDKFYCEGSAYVEVDGSLSGRISPLNTMSGTHMWRISPSIGEPDLLDTICPTEAFTGCFFTNLLTSDTTEVNLLGEWEVRANFTQPPTVRSGAVGEITKTSAVLSGSVNPNGSSVSECIFEYGPTASYGKQAKCSPAPGSGGKATLVSASLSSLMEGTTYHYRVVAENGGGTSYTADQTFATFASAASHTTRNEEEPATAEDGPVSATASGGTGTVTVGQYGENPGGVRLIGSAGEYVDVYVSTSSTFEKVEYEDCELGGGSTLEWFNPAANAGDGEWQVVTKQTYVPGSPDCIDAVAEASGTSPTITQMTGTRFKAAASAAAPEFGKCVAAPLNSAGAVEGFFKAGTCSEKSVLSGGPDAGQGDGKYEWELDVLEAQNGQLATHFALSAPSAKLETAQKAFKITCKGVAGEGEYTGPKSVGAISLTFSGCTQSGQPCTSSGAGAGEIKTSMLDGVLGWEAQSSRKVGLELRPQSGAFAVFSCGGTAISVRGSVIAPLKVNKMSATPAVKLKGAKGVQKPEGFEAGPKAILEESSNGGSSYEAMALSASIMQVNENGTEADVNTAF